MGVMEGWGWKLKKVDGGPGSQFLDLVNGFQPRM